MGPGKDIQEEMDLAFRKKLERLLPKQTIVAKVLEVNRGDFTCDVEPADGGANYHDVRLQSVIDDNDQGVVHIPKIGTYVTISIIGNDDNNCYVSQFSEIEEFIYKIDDFEFSGNNDGIRIKKGSDSLLNVIEDMIDELNKIIVIYGTSINVGAMNAIKQRFGNPLKE